MSEHVCCPLKAITGTTNSTKKYGYIKKIKVGDKEFKQELDVKDEDNDEQVVGVILSSQWEGTDSDLISLNVLVGTQGQIDIQQMKDGGELKKTNVEVDFVVKAYDARDGMKKYFDAFEIAGGTGKLATITKVTSQGESRKVPAIDVDSDTYPGAPQNLDLYLMTIQVEPQGENHLTVAASSDAPVKQKWGKKE